MKQMYLFTPRALLTGRDVNVSYIEKLCNFYKFEANIVARELNEFRSIYPQLHEMTDVNDIARTSHGTVRTFDVILIDNAIDQDDAIDDNEEVQETTPVLTAQWAASGFIKPLRVISELSGFTSLTSLYTILVSLAITSSSAERAMSKIKIVKNRLRTSMKDDWFSALIILASEKDILQEISVEAIIDKFAASSTTLSKLLSYT